MFPSVEAMKRRPNSASGKLESARMKHFLEETYRPKTVPMRENCGLDPTYLTSHKKLSGSAYGKGRFHGRQVHGGVDPLEITINRGRRATLGATENLNGMRERYSQRPETTSSKDRAVKIEETITLEHLYKMKQAFEEADADGSGTLDIEEFKTVFKHFLGLKAATEDQMTALFMKIDASSDGEINWDEFCTYMQLEYTEKEESYSRSRETAFRLPAIIEHSPHREAILRTCHTSDNNYLTVSQDGMVSFWSDRMTFKRVKQIESGTKKSKWITDFVLMPHYNKFITATGDREIQFYELSTFEPYCQITGLETVPLRLDYCAPGQDECIIIYGDSEGSIGIFMMHNVGEVLRTWKKMPRLDGVASISVESLTSHAYVKFLRWKVHDDWIQELKYYDSIRSVISSSSDPNYSLVIGPTTSSTYANIGDLKHNQLGLNKKIGHSVPLQMQRRRYECDETVFKIYKGVKTFDFCKEKNMIATGGMDRLVRLWDPYVPSKPIGILRGHTMPIFYIFIVAEDNRIFSISNDKVIKVWDLHDQSCLLTVRPKAHRIRGDLLSVHYNPVSRALAIATDHINMLSLKNRNQPATSISQDKTVMFSSLSNSTTECHYGRAACLCRPLSMQLTTTHKEAVLCAKFNNSFGHVVTASEKSVVRVWDLATGTAIFEFSNGHNENAITCMSFDSTERRLVTGSRDGNLKIWNYNNAHCLQTLEKDKKSYEVTDLIYIVLNKNRYIVSVGWDRRVSIFSDDQLDFHHIQKPHLRWNDDITDGHKEDVLSVAFCPPNLLATSSYDGEIIIWNMVSGHLFCRLKSLLLSSASEDERFEGKLAVDKLVFLAARSDDKTKSSLISNGPKGMIHFWNVYKEIEMACFKGSNKGLISAMVSNAEGTKLYLGDTLGFINCYDISEYGISVKEPESPQIIHSWRAHIQIITSLEFANEYNVIITTAVDYTARLFTFDGHFIGTFGQPKLWDINLPSSYQHPMVPFDVLMDPMSLPNRQCYEQISSTSSLSNEIDAMGIDCEVPVFDDNEKQEEYISLIEDNNNIILNDNQIVPESTANNTNVTENRSLDRPENDDIVQNLLNSNPARLFSGKRLRHERLKRIPKMNSNTNAAYRYLDYHELDDTPKSSNVNNN